MTVFYNIRWKQSAQKELKRLDRRTILRVINLVETLAGDPQPRGCKKLQGSVSLWRVRIGDYRVIYSVDGNILRIEVIKVGHRRDIYKK